MKRFLLILAIGVVMFPALCLAQNTEKNSTQQEVMLTPEQQPKFPGGLVELTRFLKENVNYPEATRESNIQGKVLVQFVVTKTGEVTDIEVLRSVDPLLDAEAVRVCRLLPRFEPGKVDGKPVNVRYVLPVNFTFNQEEPDITDESLALANAGDRDAQYNVGYCYYKGLGVPVDWIVARYYFGLAARQGHPQAIQLLEKSKQYRNGQLDPVPSSEN